MNAYELIKAAAAHIRQRAEAASTGPWTVEESPDAWSLHSGPDPVQILKAPKHSSPFAEYWPNEHDSAWIAMFSPDALLPLADYLDSTANLARVELMVAGGSKEQSAAYVQDKYDGLLRFCEKVVNSARVTSP